MKCKKVAFLTAYDADIRAGQINRENAKRKEKIQLRPYKCVHCGAYHLTKMKKYVYKYLSDSDYRHEVNQRAFIYREADYWKDRISKSKRAKDI